MKFDGASAHRQVWFNGSLVSRNGNGYTSYVINITTMACFGAAVNTIAVRDDANAMVGWLAPAEAVVMVRA